MTEYMSDLKRYLKQYIHSSKNEFSKKILTVLAGDRDELYSLGIIHNHEGQLINDSKKFSKIALATLAEEEKGFYTYNDDPELVGAYPYLYHETYHSQINFSLDTKTRANIKKIVYKFDFLPYHPWKNKMDVKVNRQLYEYNLMVAYIQFKALWTSLYNLELPTFKATKLFDEAIQTGKPVVNEFKDMHFSLICNNTLNFKSRAYEYGEFSLIMTFDFTTDEDYEKPDKGPTEEELYMRYLAS